MSEQPFQKGIRIENVDMSGVRLHGVDLEGAKLTDAFLANADISGDIEGLLLNGVEVEPLVRAELERREPERAMLRATDVTGLRTAWSMVEERWAEATARAAALPEERQHERVDGEWSVVETLRHLVFATDCWLSRAILLHPHPYHPWGLPWSGVEAEWAASVGVDLAAAPSLPEVLLVRAARQQSVRSTLDQLTDAELSERRFAPDTPGHPSGEHSVLHALHVLLNEEYEHHRYTMRDLEVLESS
ncbi:MAG TPA: DinB family protein [Acidimicrobiales bacterium]|nr:DinB family protein [Acidimicrobiales bacterium]